MISLIDNIAPAAASTIFTLLLVPLSNAGGVREMAAYLVAVSLGVFVSRLIWYKTNEKVFAALFGGVAGFTAAAFYLSSAGAVTIVASTLLMAVCTFLFAQAGPLLDLI